MRNEMPDAEVKARLSRIKKYNEHFAGTKEVVSDAQIYGFMTKEWNVDPAKYGILTPPVRKEMSKADVAKHIANATKPMETASQQERDEANNAV